MLLRPLLRARDGRWRLSLGASVAVLLGLTAAPVVAADEDSPIVIAAHWFDRADLDKDGYVTAEEVQSGRAKQFRRMDGNGDEQLTLDEFRYGISSNQQGEMELMQRQFALMDADQDGALTSDEFMSYGQALVAAGDSDGDGRLTVQEFTAAFVGE
jgi:Ca2+-binding EF-hand superfamily protein